MKDLVTMNNKSVWTDSRVVADYFTKGKHHHVKRAIEQLCIDMGLTPHGGGLDLDDPIFKKKETEYRGRRVEYYMMNKPAFIILATRFKTKEAFDWVRKFVKAFSKMERVIAQQKNQEWIVAREQGRQARRHETDIIEEFVDYATNQGSKNSKMYYVNLTRATYKALGLLQHNKPSTRDMLDTFEVNGLFMAEVAVTTSLRKYMALDVHYKKIFQLVKEDLEKYAGLIDMTGIKKLKVGS